MKPKEALVPIANTVKRLWDQWNLRGFILLSLSLQTFLILFAPFRKQTAKGLVIMSIWSGYLLADWVANFAVGLISHSQRYSSSDSQDNRDLMAFWAPFLLLHLGGPDTITAFALEDNELWLRHFLGLIFQVAACVYVFAQSFPNNKLWVPTVLIFLAGIVKYGERTRGLYLASLHSFRESMLKKPDPGPNYAKLMEEYSSKKEANLPTRILMIREPDKESKVSNDESKVHNTLTDDFEVVQHAYRFFETFKGLIVDLIFSFHERNESRDFFLKRSAEEAFKVIEVELNFIYEVLYSKVAVVHCKSGYFFRFVSFSSVFGAFAFFYSHQKHGFDKLDVKITYTLLLGAIALDTIALLMLFFSDWTIVSFPNSKKNYLPAYDFLKKILIFKISKGDEKSANPWTKCLVLAKRLLFRRWSESVSTYNLIDYCLKECPKTKPIHKFFPSCLDLKSFRYRIKKTIDEVTANVGIKDVLDRIYYLSTRQFTEELRNFIFKELKEKSEVADDSETAKEICSARGDWVLRHNNPPQSKLLHWIEDVAYDESLLLWHIATELCYSTDEGKNKDCPHRGICKVLSDYMLYLLVMQPAMMSAVAGIGRIRFRDTCAEAIKFFGSGEGGQKEACKHILGVNTEVEPVAVKGDRSKSVLFDACMLAQHLRDELKEEKWDIMSKVWVEMLSYAASHCRAHNHAQQLSKGGELVTFVWLLMAHLGLGEQFQIKEGHARAKLIVDK